MGQATLTKSEVQHVLDVLRDMAQSQTPSNKRNADRRKVALPLWLRRMPGAGVDRTQLFRIMAVDISRKGVGCLSRKRLELGETFVLPLRFAEGGGELVLCRVKFLKSLESGHFRIGAEFVATSPDPSGRSRIPGAWLGSAAA